MIYVSVALGMMSLQSVPGVNRSPGMWSHKMPEAFIMIAG